MSEKEILEILELFQKSGWEDLTLESGGVRLSISKSGRAPASPRSPGAARGGVIESPRVSPGPREAAPVHSAPTPSVALDPRWIAVKAPMLGTYYAASKPGAPPFVSVGQSVSAEDNVCILEVMKLMNYVKAGTRGTIAHIAVSNGDLVEYDQALVYIDPA
nr:acetyl-CoA carboxylase biotin carboxyl carrier protein [Panacagrimonas sp.]